MIKASSTVALVSSLNPSTFGAGVTFTATVTSGATGTVTFLEGATTLGTGTVSGVIATLTTSSLTGGPHTITAQYGGDSNYNGSTSTALTQTVNPATSTVGLVSSLNPSTFGASVTLTTAVRPEPPGPSPSTTAQRPLGTGTISNGIATLTTSSLAAGHIVDPGAVRRGMPTTSASASAPVIPRRDQGIQHCRSGLLVEPLDLRYWRDSYGDGPARSHRDGDLPRWHDGSRHRND